MKYQGLLSRGRFLLGVCLASLVVLAVGADRASAQQGAYVAQASTRLVKLIDAGNSDGFKLTNNTFSIGGGWLKQSENQWIDLYTMNLTAGRPYRFLAAGDNDAKDVDLEVLDPNGKTVASDTLTKAEAVVNYTPTKGGRYLVRVRLYASRDNLPAVCLAIVMAK